MSVDKDEDARAAIAELRRLIALKMDNIDAPELLALVDRATGHVANPDNHKRLSDALAGALTVVRFGEMFGTDPAPAIAQATKLLEGLEQLSRMPD
ncbi:MAG: hypothetical protein KF849_02780 [Rhizobiaceae bacterium]|nr:hypothetical protein [Rhizobiaceae bacterium]